MDKKENIKADLDTFLKHKEKPFFRKLKFNNASVYLTNSVFNELSYGKNNENSYRIFPWNDIRAREFLSLKIGDSSQSLPLGCVEIIATYKPSIENEDLQDIQYQYYYTKYYFKSARQYLQDIEDSVRYKIDTEEIFNMNEIIPIGNQGSAIYAEGSYIIDGVAGSGKSTTLIQKIKIILEHKKINKEKVILLVKNKELINEFNKLLKTIKVYDINILTFEDFLKRNYDTNISEEEIKKVYLKYEEIDNYLIKLKNCIIDPLNKNMIPNLNKNLNNYNSIFNYNKIEEQINKLINLATEVEKKHNSGLDNIKIIVNNNKIKLKDNVKNMLLKNKETSKIIKEFDIFFNWLGIKKIEKEYIDIENINKIKEKFEKMYQFFIENESKKSINYNLKPKEIYIFKNDIKEVINDTITLTSLYLEKDINEKEKYKLILKNKYKFFFKDNDIKNIFDFIYLIDPLIFDITNFKEINDYIKKENKNFNDKIEKYNTNLKKEKNDIIKKILNIEIEINKTILENNFLDIFFNSNTSKQVFIGLFNKNFNNKTKYEYIIIDEAQNIKNKELDLIIPITKNVILNGDEFQSEDPLSICQWENIQNSKKYFLKNNNKELNIYRLIHNFRQSYELANCSYNFRQLHLNKEIIDISEEYFENEKGFNVPTICYINEDIKFIKLINDKLKYIQEIFTKKIPIVIFYENDKTLGRLSNILEKNNFSYGMDGEFKYDVMFVAINNIAGRSFPLVLSPLIKNSNDKSLYIMLTRARYDLTLFTKEDVSNKYIKKLIEKNIIKNYDELISKNIENIKNNIKVNKDKNEINLPYKKNKTEYKNIFYDNKYIIAENINGEWKRYAEFFYLNSAIFIESRIIEGSLINNKLNLSINEIIEVNNWIKNQNLFKIDIIKSIPIKSDNFENIVIFYNNEAKINKFKNFKNEDDIIINYKEKNNIFKTIIINLKTKTEHVIKSNTFINNLDKNYNKKILCIEFNIAISHKLNKLLKNNNGIYEINYEEKKLLIKYNKINENESEIEVLII